MTTIRGIVDYGKPSDRHAKPIGDGPLVQPEPRATWDSRRRPEAPTADVPALRAARLAAEPKVVAQPRPAPKPAAAPPEARGDLPELAWLPIHRLTVDASYQRTIDSRRSQALIARIATDFRWSAFQAILAAPRGDGWVVLDGQHRAEAARRLGIPHVPAVVVSTLDVAEQAVAFVRANLDRVAVNPYALHHAQLVAKDGHALAIDAVCQAAGISIPRYPIPADKLKPGQTLALGRIGTMIRQLGVPTASATLRAVARAWAGQGGALRAQVFAAAAIIVDATPPAGMADVYAALTAFLARSSPSGLTLRAAEHKARIGGTEAQAMEAVISAGLRKAGGA